MKQKVARLLKDALKELDVEIKEDEITGLIESPPNFKMGDYAFPCFSFANKKMMNPHYFALKVREKIGNAPKGFQEISVAGPYVNFFLDRKELSYNLISQIKKQKDNFGKTNLKDKRKVMIEFPSPNTNKPLHLGHLRNMSIGESVSRILEFNSSKVIRANLNNDRGIHICKSMLAYKKYGKGKKPTKTKKSDHFVGDYYVLFSRKAEKSEKLEREAHQMLVKWEQGDKEIIDLWKKMNKWALDGFKETYEKFGIKHNKEYFESKIYDKGKNIILDGVKKGIFEKKTDGSVTLNLNDLGLQGKEKYLLRSDGTSLYMTQDIYLAKKKFEDYKIDESFYITGNEQEHHFRVLFHVLDKLELMNVKNLHHLSYGMVSLPEGKMKSREGTVVDADDLIEKVKKLVQKEIEKREKRISKKKLEERSHKITLAAIKYYLLKTDMKKNITFNPKDSINFEGNTGSYLLYSYARANSILEKTKRKKSVYSDELNEKEINLFLVLNNFQKVVERCARELNPTPMANYAYELAQTFNEFYHSCHVIGSENETFRIEAVRSFKQVMKNSLNLLGIETIDEM